MFIRVSKANKIAICNVLPEGLPKTMIELDDHAQLFLTDNMQYLMIRTARAWSGNKISLDLQRDVQTIRRTINSMQFRKEIFRVGGGIEKEWNIFVVPLNNSERRNISAWTGLKINIGAGFMNGSPRTGRSREVYYNPGMSFGSMYPEMDPEREVSRRRRWNLV